MWHVLVVRGGQQTERFPVAVTWRRGVVGGSLEGKARSVEVPLSVLGTRGWEGSRKHSTL